MSTLWIAITVLALGSSDEQDLDLAGALARRGWVDLAEEMCTRIEKNPAAGAATRAGVPLVLAEVAAVKARRETDVTRAVGELAAGIARLRSQPSLEAKGMLGWLLAQRAKLLTGAAEDDPAFRPEALKAWEAVEGSYRESLVELRKLPANAALSITETNHPGFDDVKFGMKEKYVELRNEVRAVTFRSPGKP